MMASQLKFRPNTQNGRLFEGQSRTVGFSVDPPHRTGAFLMIDRTDLHPRGEITSNYDKTTEFKPNDLQHGECTGAIDMRS
jgi:hypothetical protein